MIHPEAVILQTLRRSLRGRAADSFIHKREETKLADVIKKMGRIFGNILSSESVLDISVRPNRMIQRLCHIEDILALQTQG